MASSFSRSELRKGSDYVDDDLILCQPCSVDNKNVEAGSYCGECDAYLCKKCTSYHTALKSTKDHVLVKADQAKKSVPVVTKDRCSKKCNIHKGKTVKYYCEAHAHFGCTICITDELKTCRNVEHIPTAAANIKGHASFKTFDKTLKNLDTAYKEGIADIKKNLQHIKTDESQLKDAFQTFKKEVNDALDKLESETLDQAKKINVAETSKMDKLCKQLENQQRDVDSLMKEVGDLLSRSRNCDVYVLAQTGGERLTSLQQNLLSATRDTTYQRYSLVPNRDVLKSGALGNLATREEAVVSSGTVIPSVTSSAQAVKPRDLETMAKMMKPGVRVKRGRDWCNANEDGGPGGLGTVVTTGPRGEFLLPGCYWVKWDATGVTSACRMACNIYELEIL